MLCQVCNEQEHKYKCPACEMHTCSLPCINTHKTNTGCTGKVDTTKYISQADLKQHDTSDDTNPLVQRDYNFLLSVQRELGLKKQDARQGNKRILGYQPPGQQVKRARTEDFEYIYRRGCKCRLAPKGMTRSKMNKSHWDNKLGCFLWSIEWIDLASGQSTLIHRMREDAMVGDLRRKEGEERPEWDIYLEVDRNTLLKVGKDKLLGDLLKDRTVWEFPTMYVGTEHPSEEWEVVEEQESDSDEAPEEVSSKRQGCEGVSEEHVDQDAVPSSNATQGEDTSSTQDTVPIIVTGTSQETADQVRIEQSPPMDSCMDALVTQHETHIDTPDSHIVPSFARPTTASLIRNHSISQNTHLNSFTQHLPSVPDLLSATDSFQDLQMPPTQEDEPVLETLPRDI